MTTNIRAAQNSFLAKKWGVFNHYLDRIQNNSDKLNSLGKCTSWDYCTRELDVEKIASQLHEIGAGYYFFTVMQGTKYMAAPNETFRQITGSDSCSKRDLVLDLYNALSKYGIDLYLYFTGDGPYQNHPEGDIFGFVEPRQHNMNDGFVKKWASVLEEYAVRYGNKVKGWWIDGCYAKYFSYTNSQLMNYYNAVRKGNSDALVCFNDGVKPELYVRMPEESFTAGEFNHFEYVPSNRFINGAQAHILAPLGSMSTGIGANWASIGLQCGKEELYDYVHRLNASGCVISIDIALYRDGSFDKEQLDALSALNV